jgi:translation initiation factor IF-1
MKKNSIKEKGQIIEALPSLLFRVRLENDKEVLAYLAGKLKMNRIKVLPGDKVLVELTPYDEKRGIIVYRLK